MEKKKKIDMKSMFFVGIPRFTKVLIFHPAVFWLYWKINQTQHIWTLFKGELDFTDYGGCMNWMNLIRFIWKDEKIISRSFSDEKEKSETPQK